MTPLTKAQIEAMLPCPFCGGAADMSYGVPTYDGSYAYCTECDIRTESYKTKAGSTWDVDAAIAAWNRRTAIALHDRVAELEGALRCFLADDRFQVAVGGNPNVVEAMISATRATLERTTP